MINLFCSEVASRSSLKIYKKEAVTASFVLRRPSFWCRDGFARAFSKSVALFFSVDAYYWHFKLPILPSHFQSSLRGHGGSLRNNNLNCSLRKQNILATRRHKKCSFIPPSTFLPLLLPLNGHLTIDPPFALLKDNCRKVSNHEEWKKRLEIAVLYNQKCNL